MCALGYRMLEYAATYFAQIKPNDSDISGGTITHLHIHDSQHGYRPPIALNKRVKKRSDSPFKFLGPFRKPTIWSIHTVQNKNLLESSGMKTLWTNDTFNLHQYIPCLALLIH